MLHVGLFFPVFVGGKDAQMSLNSNIQSLPGHNYENIYFDDFMKNSVAFLNLILYNVLYNSVIFRSNILEGHFIPI